LIPRETFGDIRVQFLIVDLESLSKDLSCTE